MWKANTWFVLSPPWATRSIAILLHAVPSSVHRDGQVALAVPQIENEVSSEFPHATTPSSNPWAPRTPPIASRKLVDAVGPDVFACRGDPFLSVVLRAEEIFQAPRRSYVLERRKRSVTLARGVLLESRSCRHRQRRPIRAQWELHPSPLSESAPGLSPAWFEKKSLSVLRPPSVIHFPCTRSPAS